MTDPTDCACPNIGDALRYAFSGEPAPECPVHDGAEDFGGRALALNDDEGLKAVIGRALGAQVTNSDTPNQPLDAV